MLFGCFGNNLVIVCFVLFTLVWKMCFWFNEFVGLFSGGFGLLYCGFAE